MIFNLSLMKNWLHYLWNSFLIGVYVIHFTIHQFSILCLQLTHITDEFGRNLIWWICRIRQCLEIGRIVKLGKASMPFWFAIFLYFLLALSQKRLGYVDIRKRKASGLQVFTVSEKKKKKGELILKVICCNGKDYLSLTCSCSNILIIFSNWHSNCSNQKYHIQKPY